VTRLEAFIIAYELKPSQIASKARVSRTHLLRFRKGTDDPTREMMVKIAGACSRLLHRRVKVGMLFDLTVRWR
jgi:hypothetical protein